MARSVAAVARTTRMSLPRLIDALNTGGGGGGSASTLSNIGPDAAGTGLGVEENSGRGAATSSRGDSVGAGGMARVVGAVGVVGVVRPVGDAGSAASRRERCRREINAAAAPHRTMATTMPTTATMMGPHDPPAATASSPTIFPPMIISSRLRAFRGASYPVRYNPKRSLGRGTPGDRTRVVQRWPGSVAPR